LRLTKLSKEFLMSSYIYYILKRPSPLSDSEFDDICKVLLEHWGEWDNPKELITRDMLSAGTAFNLRACDYPTITRYCAVEWLQEQTNMEQSS